MGYHVVEPGGTFYMFPRTLIDDDIAFCEKAKLDHNLLIVPGKLDLDAQDTQEFPTAFLQNR